MNIESSANNVITKFKYNEKVTNDILSENTFDNMLIKNTSMDNKVSYKNDNNFKNLAPNAPINVKEAWNKAIEETGVNGFGIGEDGKLTHISQLFVMMTSQRFYTGHSDVLGNSKESAIKAVQEALYNINNPLIPKTDFKIIEYQKKEKSFYEAFLKNLRNI